MPDTEGSIGATPGRAGANTRQPLWRAAGPGLVIVAIAVVALLGLRGLAFGTAQHLGPAALPDILAALLLILGVAVAIEGLLGRRIHGGG
jgi:hypothetical protein